jgi:predicted outer membrane repeat protein
MYWPPKSGRGPVYLTILGNVSFVDNIAGDNGGAIYASGAADLPVSTVAHLDVGGAAVFSSNKALGSYGGAISIERSGTLAIHGDVRFQGNVGLVLAGAVHVDRGCVANISGRVVINSNFAQWGGALYAYGSTIRLLGAVSLSNNSAQTAGGCIVAVSDSFISVLDDVTVNRSSAPIGGAIYLDSSALRVSGRALLADNHAGTGGMAYLVNSASLTITDEARIDYNQADSEGGGVFVSGSSLDMNHKVMFVGNRAGGSGGAIAARDSASVRVSGVAALFGNKAHSFGGAIDTDTSVTLWLDGGSSVISNSAETGGGLSLRSVVDTFKLACS